MRLTLLLTALTLAAPAATQAQWQIQDAHTDADLRGIDSVGNGVAWASGSNGTVLRTEDAGFVWQLCAVPPGAEKLDFRGIQAFDNNTAIVMSSGKGDLSRLYQTTDGCQTWKLAVTNLDDEGFWDAFIMPDKVDGWLLGDPVRGSFVLHRITMVSGIARIQDLPQSSDIRQQLAAQGRGAFAASNSSLALRSGFWRPTDPSEVRPTESCKSSGAWFGTSGPAGVKIFRRELTAPQCSDYGSEAWVPTDVPINGSSPSSGVFSIADQDGTRLVAVGGDYLKPNARKGTAVFSVDGGQHWSAPESLPGGYRSAITWDRPTDTWITVGPNGTDISTDDGRNWRPLKPNAAAGDPLDADGHWNALSLPFVVGPGGRIGLLRADALSNAKSSSPK